MRHREKLERTLRDKKSILKTLNAICFEAKDAITMFQKIAGEKVIYKAGGGSERSTLHYVENWLSQKPQDALIIVMSIKSRRQQAWPVLREITMPEEWPESSAGGNIAMVAKMTEQELKDALVNALVYRKN